MIDAVMCPGCGKPVFGLEPGVRCSTCRKHDEKRAERAERARQANERAQIPLKLITCPECNQPVAEKKFPGHMKRYHSVMPSRVTFSNPITSRKFILIRETLGIHSNAEAIAAIIDARFNELHLTLDGVLETRSNQEQVKP